MKIFKTLIYLFTAGLSLWLFASTAQAQSYWVSDPDTCPQTYSGQNCTPYNVCGLNGGTAQCYDTSVLVPPAGDATSNTNYSSAFNGGYILDCYALDLAPDPYCNNNGAWWCDRNETCYTTYHRNTTCTGGLAASFTCGVCRATYTYCDGSYEDADGCEININVSNCSLLGGGYINLNNVVDGSCNCNCKTDFFDCNNDDGDSNINTGNCEIAQGDPCIVDGLAGVYNGCECVMSTQYFETGTQAR